MVVAAVPEHRKPAVERRVVVDALDVVSLQQRDERRPVGDLAGDRGDPAQEEDVVAVGPVQRQRVDAVGGRAAVEHVDDVVARAAAAAGGADLVRVRLGLAVERQRVPGGDVHRLEVEDGEAILAVGLRGRLVLAAVDARRAAELQVAGRVDGGPAAGAARIAELEAVDVGVAPHARDRGRDVAEQQDRRPVSGVGVRVVAVDVDRLAGEDLAVGRRRDVVADEQHHGSGERRDPAARHGAQDVLGEAHRPVVEQREVLVGVGAALAHRQADVACERLGEHERERAVGLGDEDAAVRLEPDVGGRAGAARRVDVEVVRAVRVADAAAGGVDVDAAAEHLRAAGVELGVGAVVAQTAVATVDDRAGARAQCDVAGRPDRMDLHVSGELVEVDARRGRRAVVVGLEHAGPVENVDVDLQEVGRKADPALGAGRVGGEHRDVHAADVDRRLAVAVEDARRRVQRHVAGGRGDVPGKQIAG